MANSSSNQTTYLIIGATCLAITGLALYLSLPKSSSSSSSSNDKSVGITPTKSNASKQSTSTKSTAASSANNNSSSKSESVEDDKSLHRRIEEIDREGKALFKNKEYTAAAECFTKALELIDRSNNSSGGDASGESNESKNGLMRQVVTLMNNRSAMYEKGEICTLYFIYFWCYWYVHIHVLMKQIISLSLSLYNKNIKIN